MPGNKKGGIKTAEKLKITDPDFYKRIGSIGGRTSRGGLKGFAAMPREKRIAVGRKGGTNSRRPKPTV